LRTALTATLALAALKAEAAPDIAHIFWKDLRPPTQSIAEDANLPMIAAKRWPTVAKRCRSICRIKQYN